LWANETFERKVLAAGFADCDTVFAFNTAAAGIFKKAKECSIRCILEQTIAPKETEEVILREEYQRAGIAWSEDSFVDDIVARERLEWDLADLIIAGSPFVAHSLTRLGVPPQKVAVVPYGVDPAPQTLSVTNRPPFDGRRPLQVVFVGNDMIRKGVRYLVESVCKLGARRVNVSVLGRINDEERGWVGQADNVQYVGSVERPTVWRYLREADVLVLPSLCEGSAIVTYEALAIGIPVICTENSGSIVTHEHDGFLVPLRDAGAIRTCLQSFLDRPSLLENMRGNALVTAKRYTVEAYGERLMSGLS
jgi:glycosyltransferase involved in cell wall biosynthesis